ncbi:MAG TPA: EamA family transporter, partial [Ramlibacter sp.]
MSAVLPSQRALSGAAFATLLLIALMMGANHVAARIAFNNGADVATAVVFRSTVTALVIVAILASQRVRITFTARHKRFLPAIGLLIGVQSLCLYSAVARLPVALALLAFNTYPIWTAIWSAL